MLRAMITEKPILTIEEVTKLALPLGTTAVASGDQIMRPVRWAVTANGDSPLPYLEGGELVLLVPGKADVSALLRACADANVAAVVSLTPLPAMALATAEMSHLPVLQLPAGTRIRDVERSVVGLLLDRQGHMERRSAQIYQQLIQLASENVGLQQIIHALAPNSNKAVVVQDKRMRIQVSAVPPQLAADWDDITDLLSNRNLLPD